ncbi:MAG TPA: D-alanyl-D-alanine carboxypeptidase family protein [Rhodocyclaceae bacterium]|nr:D-alanyl-D-alanine carboxypeptidase family protein [Rhodocyclaceae bacterium]HMZ82820.1 D-alanyl-D-alanine carboxypeptidase family protein [Rhodocyclaceae bacterium]HNB79834.1 D-alanyl-D-alanine carboxypeptidase family protein [Rhodocyclaceae bacterium]HNC62708.1 D-alanyl-D-alanine carboxypeptidase family protein [Rhodocyclaceae bacterium]HNH13458.1 D-alanyl-D-alanine carboxypeptidase family protein [Rhodocyclaceae bacterium]
MRLFAVLLSLCLSLPAASAFAQAAPQPPAVAARAWLLLDLMSNQIIGSEKPDERVEPASLTKLMTAYLSFAALKQKTLRLDQAIPVSARAWKQEGSRMFIEPNKPVTVDELIHGMIIQSGNDACVALAEAIAGSEEVFAQMMNREAQRLGMKNTNYMNSTGLTDPKHYTTARDLSILVSALIRDFPEYYPIYSQKEYKYNGIAQANRNRLLWMDPTVDGVKTGHTEAAGWCLIASGKRGPRRLVSVVLGTGSDTVRAQESQKLLNFGFLAYDAVTVYRKDQPVSELRVWKGDKEKLRAGFLDDFVLTLPKGQAERIKVQFIAQQPLMAPVQQGARVGTLKVSLDDKPLGDYPVVATETVAQAGIIGRAIDTVKLWMQ